MKGRRGDPSSLSTLKRRRGVAEARVPVLPDLAERSRALFAVLPELAVVARHTEIPRRRLEQLSDGRVVPTTDELLALRLHYQVSGIWWIAGEEPMLVEPLPAPARRRPMAEPERVERPPGQLDVKLHAQLERVLLMVDELRRLLPKSARTLVRALDPGEANG